MKPGEFKFEPLPEGKYKVTRLSMATGKVNSMDLEITNEQIMEFLTNPDGYVQDIFFNLNAEEREFFISGATPEEWKELFGK